MTRLIDVDKIKFEVFITTENYSLNPIYSSEYKRGWNNAVNALEQQIAELPTVERPHGEWITYEQDYHYANCSMCDFTITKEEKEEFNFCPNCGSDNRPKEGEKE